MLPFNHTVLFWLKEPDSADHAKKFEASLKQFLRDSNYAGDWFVGKAAGTDRPVVDSSYTYCLVVTFENSEKHDLYQQEPAHLRFIAECQSLWERVQVLDSIAI